MTALKARTTRKVVVILRRRLPLVPLRHRPRLPRETRHRPRLPEEIRHLPSLPKETRRHLRLPTEIRHRSRSQGARLLLLGYLGFLLDYRLLYLPPRLKA